jgi:hypothetical protein
MIRSVDRYTPEILRHRYTQFRDSYFDLSEMIQATKLPIRNQNPPEDITENIVKFIILNYEKDTTCVWSKSMGKKGDLYSDTRNVIEVKAFTSSGPSSFGPKKKFDVIYFLDMRGWLKDIFILWKVKVTHESEEWKKVKMNKKETNEDQCVGKRRPHISWDNIYVQIPESCVKVYHGTFEEIFKENEY